MFIEITYVLEGGEEDCLLTSETRGVAAALKTHTHTNIYITHIYIHPTYVLEGGEDGGLLLDVHVVYREDQMVLRRQHVGQAELDLVVHLRRAGVVRHLIVCACACVCVCVRACVDYIYTYIHVCGRMGFF